MTVEDFKSKLEKPPSGNHYVKSLEYLMKSVFEKYHFHYQQFDWNWGTGERIEDNKRTIYVVLTKDGKIASYYEESFELSYSRYESWKSFYQGLVSKMEEPTLFERMSTSNQLIAIK